MTKSMEAEKFLFFSASCNCKSFVPRRSPRDSVLTLACVCCIANHFFVITQILISDIDCSMRLKWNWACYSVTGMNCVFRVIVMHLWHYILSRMVLLGKLPKGEFMIVMDVEVAVTCEQLHCLLRDCLHGVQFEYGKASKTIADRISTLNLMKLLIRLCILWQINYNQFTLSVTAGTSNS